MTITIIKPVNWKGVIIFKVKNRTALKKLARELEAHREKENIHVSFESSSGKVSKVV
jgi:hypothetical protein